MIPFPDKKYDIIYADPPWSYSDKGCNGNAAEHGPEWKAAEEAIFQKYNEILDAKIPDEPVEVTVTAGGKH